MKKMLPLILVMLVITAVLQGTSLINREDSPVAFHFEAEMGALSVVHHTYQVGENGDAFNFRTQGGQDILFPFTRFQAGMLIKDRHLVELLYQPLTIVTKVPFEGPVGMDGKKLDGPMELTYGFPFYRATYGFDLLKDSRAQFFVGGVIQLRNASIIFAQLDGDSEDNDSEMVTSQNVGPVPALFIRGRYEFPSGLHLQGEATGIFASSRFINGANFEFEGSLLDASLRAGYGLKNDTDVFGVVRFIGGTASGTSESNRDRWSVPDETFTENRLAIVSVSIGAALK